MARKNSNLVSSRTVINASEQTPTITQGQTVLANLNTIDTARVDVFKNGIKLVKTDDYSIDSAHSITLTTALDDSDHISIMSNNPSYVNGSDILGTTATAPSPAVFNDPDTGLFSDSTDTLSIATAGTERVTVNASGNVGIGTATPAYKLDVNGDLRVQGNFTVDGVTTTINSTTLNVDDVNITVASGAANSAAADGAGLTVDGANATLIYASAGDNWSFNKDLNLDGDLTVGGGQVTMPAVAERDKYRVWNSGEYTIGMDNNFTFGGLTTEYAMTFQMNNLAGRGFWWGDNAHTDAQGAMALTTEGKLTVAHSARIGHGEADTTTPGATHKLDVNGSIADDKGDVRQAPVTDIQSTPYTIPSGSSGEMFKAASGSSTININVANFNEGDVVTLVNIQGSTKTLDFDTWANGVRIAGGDGTNYSASTLTLAEYGVATLIAIAGNRLVINGNVS